MAYANNSEPPTELSSTSINSSRHEAFVSHDQFELTAQRAAGDNRIWHKSLLNLVGPVRISHHY